jgi:YVTN family beta-propeller protein
VGREPYAVALTHRGGEAYVANAGDGTVSVVDLDRDAVVADVAVGDKPFAVAIGCTGAGCSDPPFTPKPTRTVTITPTISVTPTITPTPLSTPTPTPNPNAVVLQVGTASGRPGDRVEVSVVLDTRGSSVAGIQIDVGFAPPLAIASASNGILPCTIGPTLRDDLVLSSAFLPSSCTGSACHAIRFLLLSFTDVDPLPDRAVMFSCDVLIAPDAAPGSYPLSASNAGASDPAGNALDTNGVAGAVTVRARTAAARIFASRTSLCSGGPLDGTTCAGDAQCAGWPCVAAQSVCDGGDDDGLLCDCPGGQCDGQSACGGTSPGTCRGGSADGQCCDPDFSCAGGNACSPTQRSCLSDVAKGMPCLHDAQCPSSVCRSTGSYCAGGTFDRYACVDARDCPLGACVAPPTPSFDDTGGPTGSAGGGSTAGGGGSCAIGRGPATGPGSVWLFVLPAALLAARSRRRPARPPAAVNARAE